jgi:hypothetical protein
MKNICLILCGIAALWLCSCSKAREPTVSETPEDITASRTEAAYVFELTSVVPDENHKVMGQFRFRHNRKEPMQLHGFWFVDDKGNQTDNSNVFRVRFETFKRKESGQWVDVPAGYCGTGAREYPIQPNQDYTFLIPLWPFLVKGTQGIVGLSGTGITVESQPFDTVAIQKISSSQ